MSFFESLANSIDETIITVDRKQQVTFINRSGEELLGIISESLRGKKLSEVLENDKTIIPLTRKAVRELRPISGNNAILKIKESYRFDFSVSPLIEQDKATGAVIVLRRTFDMPGRMDEQFESIMYLLSSVAHEVKNPLAGIRGGAQLLKQRTSGEDAKHLDVIIKETERLDRVVKGYLFGVRKPALNDLNVHEVIEEAFTVLDHEIKKKKVVLKRSYDPSLPHVRGDEGKLLQAFINIIKNACEAIPVKGKIEVRTKPSFEYLIEKKKKVKRRFAVVEFRDNGPGIPDEDIDKVFMPFYTSKKGGSGLGLAISSKIIRDHNGLMKIGSSGKKGASVEIYLPFIS
ncbi:MAG: PAS domain S-box protein [Nitrospirota bacterium]|nr:MAG: PAS domain S-box protein [Nitrospirota bacterium]